jgi:hypothetical protein
VPDVAYHDLGKALLAAQEEHGRPLALEHIPTKGLLAVVDVERWKNPRGSARPIDGYADGGAVLRAYIVGPESDTD